MKTEIFATFGPACKSQEILKEMIKNGMSGMRLNLSHTTLPASADYIEAYQTVAWEMGVVPQILIDMQGPELRIGDIKTPLKLENGAKVMLGTEGISVPKVVISALEIGDEVLLDDGKISVKILERNDETAVAEVIRGGILHGHKSIKIVDKNVKMPVLTEHDIDNIRLAKQYGVTALMQPFVLGGEDLAQVRVQLKKNEAENIRIFAKIENKTGVMNLENIIPEADVIVIARGDLGNDMPLWELPAVQKQIETICKKHGKPYIVVTQMLASMEQNPVPTRAEVSDIFHAVINGAYGVMITGESAIGKYPAEAIKYLANTAKEAEKYVESHP